MISFWWVHCLKTDPKLGLDLKPSLVNWSKSDLVFCQAQLTSLYLTATRVESTWPSLGFCQACCLQLGHVGSICWMQELTWNPVGSLSRLCFFFFFLILLWYTYLYTYSHLPKSLSNTPRSGSPVVYVEREVSCGGCMMQLKILR